MSLIESSMLSTLFFASIWCLAHPLISSTAAAADSNSFIRIGFSFTWSPGLFVSVGSGDLTRRRTSGRSAPEITGSRIQRISRFGRERRPDWRQGRAGLARLPAATVQADAAGLNLYLDATHLLFQALAKRVLPVVSRSTLSP